MVKAICNQCGNKFDCHTGHLNRANKLGRRIFCGRVCSGLGRRKHISLDEKKRLKSEYDKIYRAKNKERDAPRKAAYHKRVYNSEKQRAYNQKNMQRHVEYCRRPEYRAKKHEYDIKRNAKNQYGEFWESAIALKKIEGEIDRDEANMDNQTYNKSQKRKRQWKNLQQTA